jgi:hypothetical protein
MQCKNKHVQDEPLSWYFTIKKKYIILISTVTRYQIGRHSASWVDIV